MDLSSGAGCAPYGRILVRRRWSSTSSTYASTRATAATSRCLSSDLKNHRNDVTNSIALLLNRYSSHAHNQPIDLNDMLKGANVRLFANAIRHFANTVRHFAANVRHFAPAQSSKERLCCAHVSYLRTTSRSRNRCFCELIKIWKFAI